MVTIVICYQEGTGKMLNACLAAIKRHTRVTHRVIVLTQSADDAIFTLAKKHGVTVREINVMANSRNVHGELLDVFMSRFNSGEYILTLDSDCFPVADGWLTDLVGMMENGARIAGILHPWAPPPEGMDNKRIEWRVRSQHCWDSTHVACQLIRIADLRELEKKYNSGDDTGMAITLEARRRGWKIDGFKPTRCPVLRTSSMVDFEEGEHGRDPEFNRYSCVVFGDKVYHHGGYSRASMGADRPYGDKLEWVTELLVDREGAEFLLLDGQSWKYLFDREEDVAQEKMERLFGYREGSLR